MKRYYRPASSRRQADLFYADLIGEPSRRRAPARRAAVVYPRYPVPMAPPEPRDLPSPIAPSPAQSLAPEPDDETEAVPLNGRGSFRHDPLGGIAGPNVEARWNVDAATPANSTIDIVVHLHGYSSRPDDAAFLPRKAGAAGVDLVDDSGAVRVRASQATLALVPRGRHAQGSTWLFDNLPNRAAFDDLVTAALTWFATTVLRLTSGATLTRGRVTLAAHSGGGAGMSALLANGLDPDEVMCFDSTYGGEQPIRRWAEARIASAAAGRSGLRVFYRECGADAWVNRNGAWRLVSTEVSARRLQHALDQALAQASGGAALAQRFRVQRTSVRHNDIPARYSPSLLDNIAANVANASDPPASTRKPACVTNADWLTARPQRPAPPQAASPATATRTTTEEEPQPEDWPTEEGTIAEDVYSPPDARAYTPSANAALFRTPPSPVAVNAATQWPQSTTDGDRASDRALRAVGLNASQIARFTGPGLTALRPIASAFGDAALTELLQRLRYTAARIADPPHSYDREADLTRAFGRAVPHTVILSMRTLLAIPGHFRELARRAGNDEEAFALENLGWLLMQSLSGEVRTASGFDFWLPASPGFVVPFGNPVPGMSQQLTRLIVARMLIDTTADPSEYRRRFDAWKSGVPGRMWRLETGRDTSPTRPAGAPFYSDPFTIPAPINIAAERAQVQRAWRRRVADFDAGRTTKPLSACDNSYLSTVGVIGRIGLRGLQLRAKFPSPSSARTLTQLDGLAAVQPAFEAAFQAIADLGWNDLLFETQGMGCFRGRKIPGNPAASRNMSEHSLGIAVDVNAFENGQNITGSMDPRIVALFEAFRFRWGKGFPTPDPMHFEYAG